MASSERRRDSDRPLDCENRTAPHVHGPVRGVRVCLVLGGGRTDRHETLQPQPCLRRGCWGLRRKSWVVVARSPYADCAHEWDGTPPRGSAHSSHSNSGILSGLVLLLVVVVLVAVVVVVGRGWSNRLVF